MPPKPGPPEPGRLRSPDSLQVRAPGSRPRGRGGPPVGGRRIPSPAFPKFPLTSPPSLSDHGRRGRAATGPDRPERPGLHRPHPRRTSAPTNAASHGLHADASSSSILAEPRASRRCEGRAQRETGRPAKARRRRLEAGAAHRPAAHAALASDLRRQGARCRGKSSLRPARTAPACGAGCSRPCILVRVFWLNSQAVN